MPLIINRFVYVIKILKYDYKVGIMHPEQVPTGYL
jgi:hypothetical protein